MNSKQVILNPGECSAKFEWSNDSIFVKLSGKNDNSAFTVVEDNLKETFHLPLHLHRKHTESFYVVDGELDFTVGDRTFIATKGTFVHVPEQVPHEVKARKASKMVMIYNPAGIEEYLESMSKLSEADFKNAEFMKMLDEKYDNIVLKK